MHIYTKKTQLLQRHEINAIYNFLNKLKLQKNIKKTKRIRKCKIIGLCEINKKIIGISAIKIPDPSRTNKISRESGTKITENMVEYGYVYVSPQYRGHGITIKIYKKIYIRICKDIDTNDIYVTTREDNIRMKKIIKRLGFCEKGEFTSNIDQKKIILYTKNL